jgi:hypothetical protein
MDVVIADSYCHVDKFAIDISAKSPLISKYKVHNSFTNITNSLQEKICISVEEMSGCKIN